jgi:hypothetical protein
MVAYPQQPAYPAVYLKSKRNAAMNLLRLGFLIWVLPALTFADEPFSVPLGQRQLFLDDHGVARIDNLTRTMHQPEKRGAVIKPDQPWETVLQTRSAPVWDEQARRFKLWMITSTPVDGVAGTTYAESLDGVKWTKPVLNQWKYQGSFKNNFVALDPNSSWPRNAMENVVYDPDDPDRSQRFKGFLGAHGRQPIVSPDGIHWKKLDVPPLPSDDESNMSYDRRGRSFIATLKKSGPFGRSHAIWTSPDFKKWTNTGVLIHADQEDQRLAREHILARFKDDGLHAPRYNNSADYNADIYNVGLFRYEGLYVALPAVYHATGKIPAGNTDGFHLIQLICSRDLRTWRRLGERRAFIDPSRIGRGAYDLTQLLPPSAPLIRGDELWFYYTGLKYRTEPEKPEPGGGGAICLAVLRRDGFVSLDAGEKPGTITSQPFSCTGSKLLANAAVAPDGELRAEILDSDDSVIATSEPMTGNQLHGEFRWSTGSINSIQQKPVSLRFSMRNASLYAYWLAE